MFAHLLQLRRANGPFALGMTLLFLLSSLGVTAQTASAQVELENPYPPLQLFVEKWVCPPDVPLDAPIDTFLERCKPSVESFEFALQTPAGTSAKSTAAGIAAWKDVPRGPIRITERVPPAYATTVMFCSHITHLDLPSGPGSLDPRPYGPVGVVSPIGVLETRVGVEVNIIWCHWFNVLDDGKSR